MLSASDWALADLYTVGALALVLASAVICLRKLRWLMRLEGSYDGFSASCWEDSRPTGHAPGRSATPQALAPKGCEGCGSVLIIKGVCGHCGGAR